MGRPHAEARARVVLGNGAVRTIGLKTTLDGSFSAYLHSPTKGRFRLSLWSGSTLIVRSIAAVRYQICGERTLTLKVERLSGRGSFTVDISKP